MHIHMENHKHRQGTIMPEKTISSSRSSPLTEGRLDRLVRGVACLVHEHVVGEAVVLPQRRLHVLLLHLLLLSSSVSAWSMAL